MTPTCQHCGTPHKSRVVGSLTFHPCPYCDGPANGQQATWQEKEGQWT